MLIRVQRLGVQTTVNSEEIDTLEKETVMHVQLILCTRNCYFNI